MSNNQYKIPGQQDPLQELIIKGLTSAYKWWLNRNK